MRLENKCFFTFEITEHRTRLPVCDILDGVLGEGRVAEDGLHLVHHHYVLQVLRYLVLLAVGRSLN